MSSRFEHNFRSFPGKFVLMSWQHIYTFLFEIGLCLAVCQNHSYFRYLFFYDDDFLPFDFLCSLRTCFLACQVNLTCLHIWICLVWWWFYQNEYLMNNVFALMSSVCLSVPIGLSLEEVSHEEAYKMGETRVGEEKHKYIQ